MIIPIRRIRQSFIVGVLLLTCAVAPAHKISNREPGIDEIGYLPLSQTPSASNPPALAWLNEKDANTWDIEILSGWKPDVPPGDWQPPLNDSSPGVEVAVSVEAWPWLLYTHTAPLDPGEYSWRYRYNTTNGEKSGWSTLRPFVVTPDAVRFPRPSPESLKRNIPAEHPRMFMTPTRLPVLRQSAEISTPELQELLTAADKYLESILMAEPLPWSTGKWHAGEWGEYLRQASTSTAQMDTLAFAWLLTGKEEYGQKAREHLLNYAAWDPNGPSNMRINDEVGMPVLHSVSRTYDWLHSMLTAEERQAIIEVMRIRGEEAYNYMRRRPYEQFAFNSHFGRMWHFLGEAGVAFYGEIPEAEKWLNYALTIFYGWYPAWGTADGGWAEGIWYWASYNDRVTWWLDLMRESLGVDGSRKPFFANVGDFPLYVAPPGAVVAGFGDFSERLPAPATLGRPMAAYSLFRQNPEWTWYSEQQRSNLGTGPFNYIRSQIPQPAGIPPQDVPLLKVFQRAGYALFHTDLTNPANNIHLAMRCSEFGNVSHSHNDQNAIVMSAYGQPLLVNTGTRDFYGSEFCKQYYWQTVSGNSILFDGQGQARGRETTGTYISQGMEGNEFAWVVGEASAAYPGLVKHYARWTMFLPEIGAVLVDEFETTASSATLLYHGRAQFELEAETGTFRLNNNGVSLQGQIHTLSSDKLTSMSQVDEYPLPLGNNRQPLYDEWHLKAHVPLARAEEKRQYLVTTLEVHRDDNPRIWSATHDGTTIHIVRDAGDTTGSVQLELNLDTYVPRLVR